MLKERYVIKDVNKDEKNVIDFAKIASDTLFVGSILTLSAGMLSLNPVLAGAAVVEGFSAIGLSDVSNNNRFMRR